MSKLQSTLATSTFISKLAKLAPTQLLLPNVAGVLPACAPSDGFVRAELYKLNVSSKDSSPVPVCDG